MAVSKAFKKMKKTKGEAFAQTVSQYDNGILDVPNINEIIKHAGTDPKPILEYLSSLKKIEILTMGPFMDPLKLLETQGYDAFYVDSLEKQNSFKHYFAKGEELCTFNDDKRFEKNHIIVCIKKNIDEIERKDPPQREDEYATSLMTIQIPKNGRRIFITNRYNHTVENPDNTYGSNPDKIAHSLSGSLKYAYGVDFSSSMSSMPNNYIDANGQLLKTNQEINGIYFGDGFYYQNEKITEIDASKELMLDNFILDLETKEIKNPSNKEDGFISALNQEIKDKTLQVIKNKDGTNYLTADGVKILELKESQIIGINFPNITELESKFLSKNTSLKHINTPNVTKVGKFCLKEANALTSINMPNLKEIDKNSFRDVNSITNISLPNLTHLQKGCFSNAASLASVSTPNLETIGDLCFASAPKLSSINMPNLSQTGQSCFEDIATPAPQIKEQATDNDINTRLSQAREKLGVKPDQSNSISKNIINNTRTR